MFKKRIKGIINTNKVLIQNFSYITVLQLLILVIPLVTYPYLIRILGKDLYGLTIYAQTIVAYFTIIINFGFNISATKDVSINRDDKKKLSEIVSSVYIIKFCLFFICFLPYCFLIYLVPYFREHYLLFLFTYGLSFGEVLLPVWFYQGIEKMKYMTYVSVFSRVFFTSCIFIFIKTKSDYLYLPLLMSLGSFFGGIISLFLVFVKEKINFNIPKLLSIYKHVKRTLPFFFSRLSVVLSTETNTVVIGAYLGMGDVAYYDLAKKITSLFMTPNAIINTVVYPKIAKDKELFFVKKVLYIRLIIALILYFVLVSSGNLIIDILGGEKMMPAYPYVITYGLFIIIASVSHYIGSSVLVAFNYENKFNMSVMFSFVFYLILMGILILSGNVSLMSVVSVFLIIETSVTIYRYYYCREYKLL